MPSGKNKSRQENPDQENDKSFTGNEEKQLEKGQKGQQPISSPGEDNETERDEYRSRNLEIEKERD